MKRLLFTLAFLTLATSAFGQFIEQRISGRDYKVYYLSDYGIRPDSANSTTMHTRLKALLSGKKNAAFICDTNRTYIFTYTGVDSLMIPEGCAWLQRGSDIRIYAGGASKGFVLGGDDVIFDGGGGSVRLRESSTLTGAGQFGCAIAVGSYETGTGYSGWTIRNCSLQTDKASGNALGVFGRCSEFLISNTTYPANATEQIAILLHWGGISNIDTVTNAMVTKHPHNGRIEYTQIDSLGYSATSTGIFCSAVWDVSIVNADISFCGRGIVFAPGDYGFVYQDTTSHGGRSIGQGNLVSGSSTWRCRVGYEISGDISATYLPASRDTADVRYPISLRDCFAYGDGTNNGYKVAHADGVTIENCAATNHNHGIYIGEGANNTTVLGCDLYRNAGYGIEVHAAAAPPDMTVLRRNRIWRNNVNAGIDLKAAARVWCEQNYLGDSVEPSSVGEYGQEYGIYIDTQSTLQVHLQGNYIRNAQTRCGVRANNLSRIKWWCDNTSALDTILLSGGVKVNPAALDGYCLKGENADTLGDTTGGGYVGVNWGGGYVVFSPLWLSFDAGLTVDTSANGDTLHIQADSTGGGGVWGESEDYLWALDNDADSVLTIADNDAGVVELSVGEDLQELDLLKVGLIQGWMDSIAFNVSQGGTPMTSLYVTPSGLGIAGGDVYDVDYLKSYADVDIKIRGEGTGRIRFDDSVFYMVHTRDSAFATIRRIIDSVKLIVEDSLDEYEPRWLESSVDQFVLYEPSETDSLLYITDDDVSLRTTITTGAAQSGGIDIQSVHAIDAQGTGLKIYELNSALKNYLMWHSDSLNVVYDYGANDSVVWAFRANGLINPTAGGYLQTARAYFDSIFSDTIGASVVDVGNGSGDGSVKLWGSTNGSFEIRMNAASGDSMVWIVKDTTAGYVLTTDGSGNLRLAAPTGGTGSGVADTGQVYVGGVAYPVNADVGTGQRWKIAFGGDLVATRTNVGSGAYDSINVSVTGAGAWFENGDTSICLDPQTDSILKVWESSNVVYLGIGNDQTWVSLFANADSVVVGPDGLTTADSIRMFNYIRFGDQVLDSTSVAALLDLTSGSVDSTSIPANALSLDDINWRGEYINLPIVYARGDTPTDSVFLLGPRWQAGQVLFHDSTCQGSDIDSVWVGGMVPFGCEVDSLIICYRGDGGGTVDSLKLYGVDRSDGDGIVDSLWYEADVALAATSWTRAAYYINEDVNAGENFALKFRNTLSADDDWIEVAYVQVWVKR